MRTLTYWTKTLASIFLWWVIVTAVFALPWRLAAIGAESFLVSPGMLRQTQSNSHYWECQTLEIRLARKYGWKIEYVPGLMDSDASAYGVTDPRARTIYVDASLSWDERYLVLLHEGAHALQPFARMNTGEKEVFAESVAALLSPKGVRESARYMSTMKIDVVLTMLFNWRDIYHVADELSGD